MKACRKLISSVAFLALAAVARATTFPVMNTADLGAGSLRQAILDANANPGADTISFNITGSGVQTIAPASALPIITEAVTIDGYLQPGATANTNGPGLGLNTILQIEIDCTNAGPVCLNVNANNITVRGLIINRSSSYDIQLTSGTGNAITGCFLGANASGTANFAGKDFWGVNVVSGTGDTIGGLVPAARNLINASLRGIEVGDSANLGLVIQGNLIGTNAAGTAPLGVSSGFAISLRVASGTVIGGLTPAASNVISGVGGGIAIGNSLGTSSVVNTQIQGNFLGTDVTGTKVIGIGQYGIAAYAINNTIGGTVPGAGNVIAGSDQVAGITIQGGRGTVVQGNFIGTDSTGTLDLGNLRTGVDVEADNCVIGGVNPGEANLIAFSGQYGVTVDSDRVMIRGNLIYGTKGTSVADGLGIDLTTGAPDGVTPNDPGDLDSGGNGLQNFPIITSVTYGASSTTVQGTLNSAASTVYDIDVYANPACASRPQEWVQGRTYLGATPLTTDGSGNGSFSMVFPVAVPAGSRVTATATSPLGQTSEFSQRNIFATNPKAGPSTGGTNLSLSGMLFQAPATVTIGGQPAANIVVVNPLSITCDAPALPAGSVNAITVTSGGLTGTLQNAFVSFFNDVPQPSPFNFFVDKLVANGITAGCGGGNYCPTATVTRAQMAVFLLRGNLGLCYTPPPATGTVFTDVPLGSFAAAYIEALSALGVTGGCGGGNYCPSDAVTRAQMAVFLLRTQGGPTYTPPPCTTATFTDVPCSSGFSKWIYELVRRNITAGCGGGNYCPNDPVTRGQMAVFVSTTFGLP